MKDEFKTAFVELSNDDRVTVWHVSVYMALFFRWHANAYNNPISITRREIMELAHIEVLQHTINASKNFSYLDLLNIFLLTIPL